MNAEHPDGVLGQQYPKPAYAWYVVGVLMLAYILSYVDRTILTLLVDPIKNDIGLSDTEVSLLHGLAFALFYTIMGFPIGRLADNGHRVGIIGVGVALWSLATALCGITKSFFQLFLARVGVGFGEAALNPSAYSLIADYFPPGLISRATSTYVMGTYLGFGLAYIIGGKVVEAVVGRPDVVLPVVGTVFSWQFAFFYVALPGLLILLLLLTVKEPSRKQKMYGASGNGASWSDLFSFLKTNKGTFACHSLGFGLLALLVNGAALWTPSFLARTYEVSVTEAGVDYGILLLIFGASGVYFGGWVADRFDRVQRSGGPFKSALIFSVCVIVPTIAYPLMPSYEMALLFMAPMIFCSSAPWGVAVSALQQIAPNELRGQVGAVYLFTVNLIGIGFGPTAIALVTDYYFADPLALRYSLSFVTGGAALVAATALFLGVAFFRESLARATRWQGQ